MTTSTNYTETVANMNTTELLEAFQRVAVQAATLPISHDLWQTSQEMIATLKAELQTRLAN